ncbi:uncharacterized protein B0P05DRAFT_512803 [Gilbertella persicaria]|uniref:NADH:flavin oxidoreductase/NADH oxidase N-terminal domain-containing protein n=1 Tax=Rhizopus stolonifer TaxID=4846 RepID=A0A367KKE2_RHIST|nr:uncharacterized protein B0P05DRAFT_512803 [Gilbertella persicaria]KAI8074267.1 hypothetical protein B0P05DRAFT_512803 [Gilbertella persicaria]RCI02703.1 hypothetical protein CU098_005144 [Rhizopus stolonifer]
MSTALFSPIKIGRHTLNHRVILAPLTRFRATEDGVPTEIQAEYYQQRASEGGLLITEATFITDRAGGIPYIPGIYSQKQIEGWKKVTRAVHEKKAVIYLQLWHIGRAAFSKNNPNQEQVVSASDVPIEGPSWFGEAHEVPRPLTIDEIQGLIQEFRQAVVNAIEAGFDGVEIQCGGGFIIDQFINSGSNKRTDNYGGSVENRTRLALEIIDTITDAVGADRIGVRLSPGSTFGGMQDEDVVATTSYLVSRIQERHPDLAYLHFIEPRADVHMSDEATTNDTLEPFRKIWKGPLITASGFSTAREYAFEFAEKTGSMIAFGRAFIANPDLPQRLLNGSELNKYDRSTFYTRGPKGFIDYPFLK